MPGDRILHRHTTSTSTRLLGLWRPGGRRAIRTPNRFSFLCRCGDRPMRTPGCDPRRRPTATRLGHRARADPYPLNTHGVEGEPASRPRRLRHDDPQPAHQGWLHRQRCIGYANLPGRASSAPTGSNRWASANFLKAGSTTRPSRPRSALPLRPRKSSKRRPAADCTRCSRLPLGRLDRGEYNGTDVEEWNPFRPIP